MLHVSIINRSVNYHLKSKSWY